jgi:tetratricopeptide (TPR) repeat protein
MEPAIPLYEEALVLAGPLGIDPAVTAYLMTSLGKCYQIHGNLEKALEWCERSLVSCEERNDHSGAARSLLTTCRIHYLQGNKAEMFDHTERGLEKAKQAGDSFRIGEALAFLGYIYITSAPDKVDQGIAHLHESVAILDQLGDKIGLQNCYNLLGNAQTMQGDFLPARTTFEQNQKICFEVGMRDDEIICYLNLAICGLEMGDFEEGAAAAQSAYAYALMNQNKFYIGLALILEATAKSYLGEYKGAVALFERALALALEAKNKYVESLVMQYKVETYLVLGHLGEAKAAAKRLIALIQETGDTSPESRMKAFLGEIVGRQGDLGGGREYIQLAISAAMVSRAKGIQVRALKVDAWISLQAGEWAEAKELALQALEQATAIGAKYLVAELEGILGEIALATRASDPTEHWERMEDLARAMKSDLLLAQALFGQAATLGNPMRAVPLVKQAQDLLKGLLENLDDDSRICFANLRERNRILEGDFINGYKPKARDINIKVSLPGIKLGQNVWGLT